MTIWLCFRWWYGHGWRWALRTSITNRLHWCSQAFSVSDLIKTWFKPFKQTFTNRSKGSIDIKVHALVDNTVSRLIGMLARTVLLIASLLCAIFVVITGILFVVVWPLIPLSFVLVVALIGFGVGV